MDRTKRFEGKVAFITGTGGGLGNSTIAIFYAKADDPDMGQLGMRVIPIGKVTSDLGAFDEMESRLEFTFDKSK